MTTEITLLLLAAIPLMGSPGPATLSLAATGAAFGPRHGLLYMIGIAGGTIAVLLMIASGFTGILLGAPALKTAITILATLYIVYLAFKIATAPALGHGDKTASKPTLYGGLVLAVANPKAYAAIGAVYSGHTVIAGNLVLDSMVKIATLSIAICIFSVTWLCFGALLAKPLHSHRHSRMVNIGFAVLLLGSVVFGFVQS
jgi:threonine/homoserine/homoserine lactone efflux protein